MSKIHKTGEFTDADWDGLPLRIKATLNTVGAKAQSLMRSKLENDKVSGKTQGSVIWITRETSVKPRSPAKVENMLDPPTDPYVVSVGSKEPSLYYTEVGSPKHTKSDGSAEFIESMKEWAWRALGINADGSPEDISAFWRIVKYVRDNGTEARPFLTATREELVPEVQAIFVSAVEKYIRSQAKKARAR